MSTYYAIQWIAPPGVLRLIDQRQLPHEMVVVTLDTVADVVTAIKEMYVRGAPLIGVTAAYGIYLAARRSVDAKDPAGYLVDASQRIKAHRDNMSVPENCSAMHIKASIGNIPLPL